MKNKQLAQDYLIRSRKRLKALETLYQEESWADVVREAQEIVELALKGLLRHSNIEVPRVHDVGPVLTENKSQIAQPLHAHLSKMARISHDMRRDRELAYYGSEDLTPSDFYREEDAKKAKEDAGWVVSTIFAGLVRD